VTLAAFADVGTVFNLRKGSTQAINSNFLPDQPFLGSSSIGNLLLLNNLDDPNFYQQTVLGGFIIRNGEPLTKPQFLSDYCQNDPTK
jgi:hypothetical protein